MGLSSILKAVLPNLATALPLPPPFGAIASGFISKALGGETPVQVTPDNIEKLLEDAQTKDPEIMLKLKEADQAFQLQMKQLGINDAQHMQDLAAADRSNARAREVAVKDKTPMILAYMVVGLTAGAEGYLLFHVHAMTNMDPSWAVIIGRILGTLDAALITVLTYYFGSSSSSQSKDATIHEVIQGATGK